MRTLVFGSIIFFGIIGRICELTEEKKENKKQSARQRAERKGWKVY